MAGISSKALNNAIENKYRFNSGNELQNKEFGDGSGLDWYDATFRGYDPQIGRFMQVDPLADWLANQSPYSFAYNNPILFNDPLGLTPDSTGRPLSTTPANAVVLEEIVITSRSVEKPKMYSDEGMASAQPQFIPALGTPSEPSSSNAGTLAVAATVLAANPEAYPVTVPVAVAAGTAVLTYYTIQALLSDPHGVGYSLPSPYAVRDNTNYQPRPVIAPPHLFSKGGKQNVWPDGQYQKPNPQQIDWKKGDQELADEITGKNVPRGPGSPNNLIKKWFRDKRPK